MSLSEKPGVERVKSLLGVAISAYLIVIDAVQAMHY
jgi:hypothetical protein